MDKGTFRVIQKEEAGLKANIFGGRFVLGKKCGNQYLDLQGAISCSRPAYMENKMLVNTSNTLRKHSAHLLITIAVIKGFSLLTKDVSQVYLQSN